MNTSNIELYKVVFLCVLFFIAGYKIAKKD